MADEGREAAELIEFIAKGIVQQPDDVKVSARDGGALIELETASEDRGRVIGRQGRVAERGAAEAGAQELASNAG